MGGYRARLSAAYAGRATNIAEVVYFATTGEVLEDERPKADRTAFATLKPRDGGSGETR